MYKEISYLQLKQLKLSSKQLDKDLQNTVLLWTSIWFLKQ